MRLLILAVAGSAVVLGGVAARPYFGSSSGLPDPPIAGSSVGLTERSEAWIDTVARAGSIEQAEAMATLSAILLASDHELATRAAVLIGALLADKRVAPEVRFVAADHLLTRLSMRIDTGARWSVGVDVVAARSLDRLTRSDDGASVYRQRLHELCAGQKPHPSLAVRVECAATVLELTTEAARTDDVTKSTTGFLLAVLRTETPDEGKSPRTWPRITTLAWVKTRSAETLARWTGTKNLFRPDGPWAHETEEANRLEALLK
ncbi:MAG: hypothetical protein ACI8WY_004220 [Planctomycetota bacterium]|jgi:hypothetical protein